MRAQLLLAVALSSAGLPSPKHHTVTCDQRAYEYVLSAPKSHDRAPAIMLLHGAGGEASEMVDLWAPLAAREHIVLIAPQLPRELAFEQVAPAVFRCVLADAERLAAVDPDRVYLFGYSMGGYLAYDGAMFDSDIFAGAGVYASVIDPDYYSIIDHAKRKIPIAIFIGDRDQYNPVNGARQTRDVLEQHGFPVHYREFPGQDHSYSPVGDSVDSDAWRFLSAYRLPH